MFQQKGVKFKFLENRSRAMLKKMANGANVNVSDIGIAYANHMCQLKMFGEGNFREYSPMAILCVLIVRANQKVESERI